MKTMKQVDGRARAHGNLAMVLIKKDAETPLTSGGVPRFAPAWQTPSADLPWRYWLRSLRKELDLRLRVAGKGLYRGLVSGGGVFGVGRLTAVITRKDGTIEPQGLICTKSVTDAGVAFMVDDWDVNTASSTNDITTLKYHACGTGTVAENVTDTGMGTEITDATRPTGTQSQPAANQLRSVATVSFTNTYAVTEHGLMSAASAGTLWDRSKFAALNVVSGDSIQFTYTVTVSSGG